MEDARYGSRNQRGEWKPAGLIKNAPIFAIPPQPLAVLKWLFLYPGYLLPWGVFFAGVSALVWFFLTPPVETMRTLAPGWIAWILVRNMAMVFVFFGAFHLRLYVRRRQGIDYKYNPRWIDGKQPGFMFGSQTVANLIWTFASGVPIWTAYEVLTLWAFANRFIPWVSFAEHPVYLAFFMLLLPLIHEFHFYVIHRLIHWPPLYRTVHRVHHANINPGPWSSLSMHPVEHLLYFSGVLIHWIVPSNPLLAIFQLHNAGLGSVVGHIGFDKMAVGKDGLFDTHAYAHQLHHKYFEVNYADGAIPLDRWFGTFHDGSPEADEAMKARRIARATRRPDAVRNSSGS
jgi:sterol desaturase/sphingolipid hydroxylase (fatty acid hydroxylase superfamily)